MQHSNSIKYLIKIISAGVWIVAYDVENISIFNNFNVLYNLLIIVIYSEFRWSITITLLSLYSYNYIYNMINILHQESHTKEALIVIRPALHVVT